jgi:hypothetical protein
VRSCRLSPTSTRRLPRRPNRFNREGRTPSAGVPLSACRQSRYSGTSTGPVPPAQPASRSAPATRRRPMPVQGCRASRRRVVSRISAASSALRRMRARPESAIQSMIKNRGGAGNDAACRMSFLVQRHPIFGMRVLPASGTANGTRSARRWRLATLDAAGDPELFGVARSTVYRAVQRAEQPARARVRRA